MSFANHSTQSFLIAYTIYPNLWFAGLAAFLGLFPDFVQIEGFWTGIRWDGSYAFIHNRDKNVWWLWFIPFLNLHIAEDKIVHREEGGWEWFAYIIELFLDCFMAFIIWRIFLI